MFNSILERLSQAFYSYRDYNNNINNQSNNDDDDDNNKNNKIIIVIIIISFLCRLGTVQLQILK